MFSFLFRLAGRAVSIRKSRFLSLTLTLSVASVLLVVLTALYFNAESRMALELSGVPNMVVEPQQSIVATSQLHIDDLRALKSEEHFWRNNIAALTPVQESEVEINGTSLPVAGTWFQQTLSVESETFQAGLLTFTGWSYEGEIPGKGQVVVGAQTDVLSPLTLQLNGTEYTLSVAGTLSTGSYWDNYLFVDLAFLQEKIQRETLDQILVSSLIKPKDELAVRAERYGEESLSLNEFEQWYCSPYSSSIAYTIKEVIPQGEVRVLRRITEVQEGMIRASSGVFLALFALTLVASITAILGAERMYIHAHLKDFGIMAALGASRAKVFVQVLTEIGLASLLAGLLTYGLSQLLIGFLSRVLFAIPFEAHVTLLAGSVTVPLLAAVVSLFLLRKELRKDIVRLLK